eukprot:6635915-Prymnesium_polylepis.2
MTAVIYEGAEFKPEDHAPIEPFYKSMTDPTDLYPIPDGCFTDTSNSGTPSNPALHQGGMHYELLGVNCVGNRTQEEVLRICLTICSKVDFGGPMQIDTRCVSVNYDEHGVGGHCHLQIASRQTAYTSSDCPRHQASTVNHNGLCVKNDAMTDRPLCNTGMLLNGASPCVGSTSAGRKQFVGIMCFFAGDVGPSEGTGAAGCQVGEAYIGDGVVNNTARSSSTAKCSKCVEGTYSVPERDPRLDLVAIPRPADFLSTINRCVACPAGRYCARGVGCYYRSLDEDRISSIMGIDIECPPRCPTGHSCAKRSVQPAPCGQGLYQDQRGQTSCKE